MSMCHLAFVACFLLSSHAVLPSCSVSLLFTPASCPTQTHPPTIIHWAAPVKQFQICRLCTGNPLWVVMRYMKSNLLIYLLTWITRPHLQIHSYCILYSNGNGNLYENTIVRTAATESPVSIHMEKLKQTWLLMESAVTNWEGKGKWLEKAQVTILCDRLDCRVSLLHTKYHTCINKPQTNRNSARKSSENC